MEIRHTLSPNTLLVNGKRKYRIVSVLGKGGFGITYKAVGELTDGNMVHKIDYAIKEFYMSSICTRNDDGTVEVSPVQRPAFDKCRSDFQKEAKSLRHLPPNEGIVRVNEVFDANQTSYYVMEFLGSETLQEYINNNGPLNEEGALAVFARLASAIAFLHSQKRMHLDIKPENIMLAGGLPKLIDFGLSLCFKSGGKATHNVPTGCSDGYAPVEQYSGITRFSPSADIYALGAVLFFMLTGTKPVCATDMSSDFIRRHLPASLSYDTSALIIKCMQKNSDQRYASAESLLQSLMPLTMAADANATVLIGGNNHTASVSLSRLLRCVGIMLAVAFIVLLGTIGFKWLNRDSAPLPVATSTDTIAGSQPADTPSVPEPQASRVRSISTPAAVPAGRTSHAAASAPNTSSPARQHHTRPVSSSQKPPSSGPHDLGYALWDGALKDGLPHGHGTMTFTRSHLIDSHLDRQYMAQSGDCLTGEYIRGKLVAGHWYRDGKKLEYIIIGD